VRAAGPARVHIVRTTAHDTAYERHAPHQRLVDESLSDSRHRVFWIEDATDDAVYPSLTASTRADLTIVGGGYLGLWTAVLAKRRDPDARVVLVEAETVGWAASGRNGGFCETSLTHGEANGRSRWPDEYDLLERLGVQNLSAMERDVEELGIDCHWERTGVLRVAVEPHQIPWLDPAIILDQEQTRAEIDSPLFLASSWDRESCAMVHPGRLARGLGRAAADLGVEVFEHSPVVNVDAKSLDHVRVSTPRATIVSDRVALATNVFPSLLRRNRLHTVPVYDYVLMTEPLSQEQLATVGWANRQGLADMANQFHYSRITRDNRILYGGYDAIYHRGRRMRVAYEDRPATFRRLAAHFLTTFPQLEGIRFTHRWAGAIDTSTRFTAFHGLAGRERIAYALGFTGLGVGATRFAAEVMLDQLTGQKTERTDLEMVRRKPLPFPPEPLASLGINATRVALDRADHRRGERNLLLKVLDAAGLGFDS
jgi:glycine/D-amino acid oxidase-like deaminating enzyme